MESKIRLVVVQPTSLCNLNCKYCYIPNRKDSTKMDEDTLEKIMAKVLRCKIIENDIEFLWHAGEPLIVGKDFYVKAIQFQKKHNIYKRNIINTIQTNGTLIDDEWCRFFKKYDFGVGVSVDGPDFIHDNYRKNWAEKPTHHQVMKGVQLLSKHKIETGALCVLTLQSLEHPLELFDFFYKNGFKWIGFNLEESENANQFSSFRKDPTPIEDLKSKYSRFIAKLYDLWLPHSKEIEIREFQDLFDVIYEKFKNSRYYRRPDEIHDLRIITIQKNGDITTNSPEFAGNYSPKYNNFVVGNIHQDEMNTITKSPNYIKIRNDIESGIRKCAKTCLYFDLCGGAFTSNKFTENGSLDSTETVTCVLHRQVLAATLIDKLSATKG